MHGAPRDEPFGAGRAGLFAGYDAPDGSYDETFAGAGRTAPALAAGR